MKTFFEEFKQFALRGNVLDLAVGIVIGTAFSNITNSLVTNIITPPLGLLMGNIDFKDLAVNLGGTVKIQYGLFLQATLDFIILAFALFLFVRFINRLVHAERHKQPQPEEMKSPEVVVLEQIRDQLKAR
jgi:large conductance mechanosensitive channel